MSTEPPHLEYIRNSVNNAQKSNSSNLWPARTPGHIRNGGSGNDYRVIPGDFNGDGKTDLATISPNGVGGWSDWIAMELSIPTGDGFYSTEWHTNTPIVMRDGGESSDYRVIPGDFNGDGRTDLATISPDAGGIWAFTIAMELSNGTGFTPAGWPSDTPIHMRNAGADRDFRVIPGDFNEDGKTDLVTISPNGEGSWVNWVTIELSDPSSDRFTSTVWNTDTPIHMRNGGTDKDFRVIPEDYNGDGKTDLATISPDAGSDWSNWVAMELFNSSVPDLLTSISNGIGGKTTITYQPLTRYWTATDPGWLLPFITQNVSTITGCSYYDGVNCNAPLPTITYNYRAGYYNRSEREFRGFDYITATNSENGNTTETWYYQGNGSGGPMPDDASASPGYMQGIPYQTKTWLGNPLSSTLVLDQVMSYAPDINGAPYFTPLAQTVTTSLELTGESRTTQSNFDYDGYGNIITEYHYGDTNVTGDERTVSRTFSPNDAPNGPWILGLPATEAIYRGIGVANKESFTTFYYDGVPQGPTGCDSTSTNQVPTQGDLTRVVSWLNTGSDPEIRTAYDAFGNLVCTKDANGNKSTIVYDPTGTFPIEVHNALGHPPTKTTYYGVNGVPDDDNGLYGQVKSVTDPNNQTTTTTYDKFGRKKRTTLPDLS